MYIPHKMTDPKNIKDFDELLQLVKDDSSIIDVLTDEQVTGLRKKINPYGRTIEGSGEYGICLFIGRFSLAGCTMFQ